MSQVEHSILNLKRGAIVSSPTDTYEIIAELGRGGMGVVYEAVQKSVERTVAIKMLNLLGESSAHSLQRLMREARLCASLDHPSIIKVYGFHADERSQPFIVMEYVKGATLADILKERGLLDKSTFIHLFSQLLDGLQYAHMRGLVHRDIKPSNIMVTADGTAKLMDFGIAKDTLGVAGTASQGLTQTGALIGSPWYMSPEQCSGQAVDSRSDLYSLGCVMYECLSGKLPFSGESAFEVMFKQLHEQILTGNELKLPEFSDLVCKALAKNPAERFMDAQEMQLALEASASHSQDSGKRTRRSGRRNQPRPKKFIVATAIAVCVPLSAIAFNYLMQQKADDAARKAPANLSGRQLINAGQEALARANADKLQSPSRRAASLLEATRYFQGAVTKSRQEDRVFDEAEALYNLAFLQEPSDSAKAAELMEYSAQLYKRVRKNSSEHATALSTLAQMYVNNRNYPKLKSTAEELIKMNSEGDLSGRATRLYKAQFDLARAYFGLGDDKQGERLLSVAKRNAAELEEQQLTMEINAYIADRLVQKQKFDEAIKQIQQNLAFIDSAKEDTRPLVAARAQQMLLLVEIYFALHRWKEMVDVGNQLLPIWKATDPTGLEAQSLLQHRIAVGYELTGKRAEAIQGYERAAEWARRGIRYNPKSEHVLTPLNSLFYHKLSNPSEALSIADEMYKHAERTHEIHKFSAETNRGIAYIHLKNLNAAYSAFRRAEPVLVRHAVKVPVDQHLSFYRHLAYVEDALGNRAAAGQHLDKLEALCKNKLARPDLVKAVQVNRKQFEQGEPLTP